MKVNDFNQKERYTIALLVQKNIIVSKSKLWIEILALALAKQSFAALSNSQFYMLGLQRIDPYPLDQL